MKKWVFVILPLAVFLLFSMAAITVNTTKRSQSMMKSLNFDKRLNRCLVEHASARGTKDSSDGKNQAMMPSQEEKEFALPMNLGKRDRIFVFLVFISSITTVVASVVSIIIKTKRSKFRRRDQLIREYKE